MGCHDTPVECASPTWCAGQLSNCTPPSRLPHLSSRVFIWAPQLRPARALTSTCSAKRNAGFAAEFPHARQQMNDPSVSVPRAHVVVPDHRQRLTLSSVGVCCPSPKKSRLHPFSVNRPACTSCLLVQHLGESGDHWQGTLSRFDMSLPVLVNIAENVISAAIRNGDGTSQTKDNFWQRTLPHRHLVVRRVDPMSLAEIFHDNFLQVLQDLSRCARSDPLSLP